MQKLTFILNTSWLIAILLSTLLVQGMESTFVKTMADKQDHTQLAAATEKYNETCCLLTRLPNEALTEIFSHCLAQDENQSELLENNIKNFMRLGIVCKKFNGILTFKTSHEFCKNYTLINKNHALLKLWKNMIELDQVLASLKDSNFKTNQEFVQRVDQARSLAQQTMLRRQTNQ